jgi:hypothetical protein
MNDNENTNEMVCWEKEKKLKERKSKKETRMRKQGNMTTRNVKQAKIIFS